MAPQRIATDNLVNLNKIMVEISKKNLKTSDKVQEMYDAIQELRTGKKIIK